MLIKIHHVDLKKINQIVYQQQRETKIPVVRIRKTLPFLFFIFIKNGILKKITFFLIVAFFSPVQNTKHKPQKKSLPIYYFR